MAKEERSKGACWTCRLRRKKCDELSPSCEACKSHSLPCYGYEKPDWADGSSKQKAKQVELQKIIRESASTKRKLTNKRPIRPFNDLAISLPGENGVVTGTIKAPSQLRVENTTNHFVEISEIFSHAVGYRDSPEHHPQDELLAHYVDVVFPSQFPLSSNSKNARDWLLRLLLSVPPLYHVAIGLAAYHKDLSGESIGDRSYGSMHHGLALKELRQYLTKYHDGLAASLESNVDVLASIVLLVSLEVLMGDTESWFIHLKGPLLLLPTLQLACVKRSIMSTEHQIGLQVFAGIIVWYNALSCASTGLIPWAPISCLRTAINGWVSLSAVTGCHDKVAISIIETGALNVQNKSLCFGKSELAGIARQIDTDLREWTQGLRNGQEESGVNLPVTRVYANAARIYLKVVASKADSDLPDMCTSVDGALVALRTITDLRVLGTLAWPLCITGCMAMEWQKNAMKDIFISMKKVPSLQLGGMVRCQNIIEECWRLRQEEGNAAPQFSEITWVEAMSSLDMKILLV